MQKVLTIFVRAKFAEVRRLFLLVLLDLLYSVTKAGRVHPLLAWSIAPEHLLFRSLVEGIVRLAAEAVELLRVCEVILALW